MIEVLVTLVILLLGLLGLAGLSIRANSAEMESYQRVQALLLLQDMVDRLNANRKVASCYSNGATGVALASSASSPVFPTCTSGSAAQNAQALADLQAWDAQLKGQSETEVVASVTVARGAMIGTVGCITQAASPPEAPNTYLVAVSWQGLMPTAAPTLSDGSPFPCGNGLYGNETLHRVVTAKVRIGDLSGSGVVIP